MARFPFDTSSMTLDTVNEGEIVLPDRLTADWIRTRFADPPFWRPELRFDKPLQTAKNPPIPASVLIPIVSRDEGLSMLMTQRTDHLHDHPGQVSFPGGREDEADASPFETALREAEEEIGLHRRHVDIIGTLPHYVTASGYRVTPVVSIVQPPFSIAPEPFEVADVFEVPLSYLMAGANHRLVTADFPQGLGRRTFYAIPYDKYFIWGATAGMLRNLFHFLRA